MDSIKALDIISDLNKQYVKIAHDLIYTAAGKEQAILIKQAKELLQMSIETLLRANEHEMNVDNK